ncbi:MAG: hypothetical protein GY820_23990 [Gammaproteobacteria bacterium]|nr:hypothetical protein [Gammaproteobacteria bacterium]
MIRRTTALLFFDLFDRRYFHVRRMALLWAGCAGGFCLPVPNPGFLTRTVRPFFIGRKSDVQGVKP